MRFHLKEIEDIMNLKRTSNWVEPETMKQYIYILQEKAGNLRRSRSPSRERKMLKKLGYTVTDRTIGSVWETKNRFCFACHLPKEEMRIVYFKAERDAGQNI